MSKENVIISGDEKKLEEPTTWKEFIDYLNTELKDAPAAIKDDNYISVWSDEPCTSEVGRIILSNYKKVR